MPRPATPRYVQIFTDRHGQARAYFRKAGSPRLALPLPIGSAEFHAAYAAALTSAASPPTITRAAAPGSFSALVVSYYQSPDFIGLQPTTGKRYRAYIERFRAAFGHLPVKAISAAVLQECLESLTPGAAINMRRVLRILFRRAVLIGLRTDNPMSAVRLRRQTGTGFQSWEESDIAAFEAHWPCGSRPRLALALLLYTAQRRGDVVSMGRQHIRDGRIEVRQNKTGTRLAIRIHPALQTEIDAAPDGPAFLLTDYGLPFSAAGFSGWFVEKARAAGLPKGLSPHGLRKAAARRLAEAGCSANEIMAVTGHKSLTEVRTYTQAADQMRLADAAIAATGKRR